MAEEEFPRLRVRDFPFTPSAYPGRRPQFSFLFTPRGIYRCALRTMDRLLATRHLAAINARYAVLAYGSNACPSQQLPKPENETVVRLRTASWMWLSGRKRRRMPSPSPGPFSC